MRRLWLPLLLLAASACYLPPPQPSAPPAQPAPQPVPAPAPAPAPAPLPAPAPEVRPPPPPPPAPPAFGAADNASWMRALRLSVDVSQPTFAPGQPIFAQVTLANVTRAPVPVSALTPEAVALELSGPAGALRCRGAAPASGERLYSLQPGQRVSTGVDLTAACGPLPAGRYTLIAHLELPGPWSVAAQGTLTARTGLAVEQPRQAAISLALAPPAAESLVTGGAGLRVTVSNLGNAVGRVPGNARSFAVEAVDGMGRAMRCRPAAAGPVRALAPGRSFTVTLDAARACDLSQPGDYSLAVTLEVAGQPVRSNAVAQVRRAPKPRARLDLFASTLPRHQPGRPLPLELRLSNAGPDAVYVFGFAPHLLRIEAFGDGRPLPCRDLPRPNPAEQRRYRLLPPGGQLTGQVDLAQVCQLSGRRLEVRVAYVLDPAYDGRAWNLQAWTGVATAPTLRVQGALAPLPPPPAPQPTPRPPPVPRPLPPPPPPPPAGAHASVSFPASINAGQARQAVIPATVTSVGGLPARIEAPGAGRLHVISARNPRGRAVRCDEPAAPTVVHAVTLRPREWRTASLDLAQRCRLQQEGTYVFVVSYDAPAPPGGVAVRGQGTVRVNLLQGEKHRGGHR